MSDVKIKAIVVTVSDTRSENDDASGSALVEMLAEIGAEIIEKIIVTDDFENLRQTLFSLTTRGDANLVLTTGGTGFAPRDTTPEATRAVIEREAQGLAEAMRFETARNTPTAILSRGICGIRGECLIVNLPGSPKAVRGCLAVIAPVLQHAVNLIAGITKHDE